MNSNRSRYIAGGLLAVGLGIGAALAASPGVASADSSTDGLSGIDQLLGSLFVPAADPAQALDVQISIGGTDLFPTAGNTATALSDNTDIAIAIGNGADANATGGAFDFAFADGTSSTAEAGFNGAFDSALVFGANSTADAGVGFPAEPPFLDFAIPALFDHAAVFSDTATATATGIFVTDIVPSP
jgi:hypothetical protein